MTLTQFQFINAASGKEEMAVGQKLKSRTTNVASTGPFIVDGHPVILIDTPGFDNTQGVGFNDIMTDVKLYLTQKYVNILSKLIGTNCDNRKSQLFSEYTKRDHIPSWH
jgi:hypothetical protein